MGPFYLVVFGIWQYLRAAFIILTPLGDPTEERSGLFASAPYHYGFYPSGHTSNTLFAYLFCNGTIARTILAILFILMAALIFGHAHYSIDIFSGVIFSYAIVKYSEKQLSFPTSSPDPRALRPRTSSAFLAHLLPAFCASRSTARGGAG